MPARFGMNQKWIALLGKKDTPTDGVEDYCQFLGTALARHGTNLLQVRVAWEDLGWHNALRKLSTESESWRGAWAVLQYTSLSWSRRGIPFRVLTVAKILKKRGAKLAVVFHESAGFQDSGAGFSGFLRAVRRTIQNWIIRRLYRLADRAIFTVPVENIPWLADQDEKSSFVPIGSNIPAMPSASQRNSHSNNTPAIGVFCVTEGTTGVREAEQIAAIVRRALERIHPLRLIVFGRGAVEAGPALRRALDSCEVELSILDVLPADDVAQTLSELDVLLYVRGEISPQRGVAVAAIASGVPLVGYGDPQKCFPVSAAGVLLVPLDDIQALSDALRRVLSDETLRKQLRERNFTAQKGYFSWDVIAHQFIGILQNG
jgi:glycosyltransferase involved in cell wall biosynthesis